MMYRLWLILIICFASSVDGVQASSILDDAYVAYVAGEKAETAVERSKHFNQALRLYQQLEASDQDGRLLTNIGNCYFQLGEAAWAILYYLRALELNPKDERAIENLAIARQYLGLDDSAVRGPSLLESVFFVHYRYSLGERIQAFFVLMCLAILLWSLGIWYDLRPVRNLRGIVSILCLGGLMSITISQYFTDLEAVLIQPSALHRDAGEHYAWVKDEPISAGEVVTVTQVLEEGAWFRVKTDGGLVGYLSAERARLVQR